MTVYLDLIQTAALAVVVLFIGSFSNRYIKVLRNNNIPEPVVGGIIFATLASLLYAKCDFKFSYDMSLQTPLMLTFFSTVGLGASFKLLRKGGPKVLIFLLLAIGCVVIQNAIGISLTLLTDTNPFLGLIGGSITLSGGHGTGATWAQTFMRDQNMQGVMEVAMACATFGLVLGGLIGGPVSRRLLSRYNLKGPGADSNMPAPEDYISFDTKHEDRVTPMKMMETMLILSVCVVGGQFIYDHLMSLNIKIPNFICSLMIGIALVNIFETSGLYKLNEQCVGLCGTIGLSLFLAMALMSMQLWELVNLAGPMVLILLTQTLFVALYCYFVTFRVMGKDYDAAIIAGGHCGFGMGATPTAVANMESLTSRYGVSPQAFFVVPMVGAFFIDIVNAVVLGLYLTLPIFNI